MKPKIQDAAIIPSHTYIGTSDLAVELKMAKMLE
jgi:hypothetical protein